MKQEKLDELKKEGTVIYGCSDDLIEGEGEIHGEVGYSGTDKKEHGVLLCFSDGTDLEVKYGKGGNGIWQIIVLKKGSLLKQVVNCESDDEEIYSDVAIFSKGLKGAIYALDWGKFK